QRAAALRGLPEKNLNGYLRGGWEIKPQDESLPNGHFDLPRAPTIVNISILWVIGIEGQRVLSPTPRVGIDAATHIANRDTYLSQFRLAASVYNPTNSHLRHP